MSDSTYAGKASSSYEGNGNQRQDVWVLNKKNMKNFSLTYKGIIVMIIGHVFTIAGVPFVEGNVQTTIATLVSLYGAFVTLIGRYRAGGITTFGFRK